MPQFQADSGRARFMRNCSGRRPGRERFPAGRVSLSGEKEGEEGRLCGRRFFRAGFRLFLHEIRFFHLRTAGFLHACVYWMDFIF